MDTTRWECERIQVSRHWYLTLAKWNEVLQVDLGTDERNGQSCSGGATESRARDNFQWDVAGRRQRRHLHGEVRTVRADRADLLAEGWQCGPAQTGRALVEAMTRKGKGSTDNKQRNSKDTENEKGERVEGYCGHCGNGGTDKRVVCWSRQVQSGS